MHFYQFFEELCGPCFDYSGVGGGGLLLPPLALPLVIVKKFNIILLVFLVDMLNNCMNFSPKKPFFNLFFYALIYNLQFCLSTSQLQSQDISAST